MREVDAIFSTYRDDSIISRLGRGELEIDDCPPEVAEVLELAREAERVSGGAFSINLPTADRSRRLDPSGVVNGWAVQRASRFLAALDETDFCLSAGGDMVCHTAQASMAPWRIGIEDPHDVTRLIAMVLVRSGCCRDLRHSPPWRPSGGPAYWSACTWPRFGDRDRRLADMGRH
jgi:thiamine biosynthesis lipoprotein